MELEPVMLKAKVHQEIDLLPDDKLNDVYEMIHTYRLKLKSSEQPVSTTASILQLAGSWCDLPDADLATFMDEIRQRRQRAFLERQRRGTSPD